MYLEVEILPMLEEEAGLPFSGFGIMGDEEDLDNIFEDIIEIEEGEIVEYDTEPTLIIEDL